MELDKSVETNYYEKSKKIAVSVCERLQFVRFVLSGTIGTSLFYVVYELYPCISFIL
jgi:hypothetical protein